MSAATLRGSLALLIVAAMSTAPAQQPRRPLDLASFPRTSLEITHRDGRHAVHKYPFEVWVADTSERAEQGLMFVSDLPETLGMVFPSRPPQVETFWMKNTYIELDLLFIGPDHRVAKIAARAPPLSLALINSDGPVIAVLEIKGGEAERRGIHVGDAANWQALAPAP